ncbi:NitT/TauT family transport system ATP-binding protein/sulfonate transport system ATP-binding protein [Devosia sp. YR412]|uniref:ABC transporter ATP-binding protein n=1 Tax=Devosia sp. YR412 TaxID=1881030 RepID=UPI0008B3F0DB|nr:ABC transporter ATP-binding protein [Devosia sp. YR412]SEP64656.1 NitT/TauT family transport system ATP-binding protein/sulfonate transport system ATP-binding protein [Devosia sp. YR412]
MATGPGLNIAVDEKRFGSGAPLFAGLHLQIAPSSVVALIGPSGVGKSTLLRMIAGIDAHFTGSITVDGMAAAAAPVPGFVFQDPRLLPWLTAADNIRAAAPACTEAQAVTALERVELGDAEMLYPHQLSGGMQRRVALARALAVNAGLLLLDEPFVSLDRDLVSEMHRLFRHVVDAERPTVLFVSHLIDDAIRLADRVLLIDHRPARVVADIALPKAPAERDETVLAAYRHMLERQPS